MYFTVTCTWMSAHDIHVHVTVSHLILQQLCIVCFVELNKLFAFLILPGTSCHWEFSTAKARPAHSEMLKSHARTLRADDTTSWHLTSLAGTSSSWSPFFTHWSVTLRTSSMLHHTGSAVSIPLQCSGHMPNYEHLSLWRQVILRCPWTFSVPLTNILLMFPVSGKST